VIRVIDQKYEEALTLVRHAASIWEQMSDNKRSKSRSDLPEWAGGKSKVARGETGLNGVDHGRVGVNYRRGVGVDDELDLGAVLGGGGPFAGRPGVMVALD
jgi:hypothetical protein